ncbi:MAG: hypothetical protein OHK0018_09130 [Erythrobacter tepidarius]
MDGLFVAIPTLTPSPQWNGTAGSGFGGSNPAAPVDPVRTLAKPALRLLTPPNQWFTDTLDVGVIAAADDNGSLENCLGVREVRFYYEGNVVSVSEPRWNTIATERGARSYYGWWVRLKKPASTAGTAQLYIEATANDSTFQKRVIGPFLYSPQNVLHDVEITIDPDLSEIAGERYQSIPNAIPFVVNGNYQNPRFTIAKAGRYTTGFGPISAVPINRWDITGRFTVEASVPGVILGNTSYTNDANTLMNPQRTFWRFKGTNITFDAQYGTSMSTNINYAPGSSGSHWADGINITNLSPLGKRELIRGGQWNAGGMPVNTWYTECEITKLNQPVVNASLVRGCYVGDSQSDIASNAVCIVSSEFEGSDQNDLNTDRPAFTMVYTGPESVATAARSGGNYSSGAGGGVWTVTIGATVYTFDHGNGSEAYYTGASGDGYWTSDVVDWLNTLPGVTATLDPGFVAQDRVAACLSLPGLAGQGFGATSFKDTPLQIVWNANSHGDWYQHTRDNLENVIIAFNKAWELTCQIYYLAPPALDPGLGGVSNERDILMFGNLTANIRTQTGSENPEFLLSQFGRRCDYSHVVWMHNTMPNQGWLFDSRILNGVRTETRFLNNVVFKNNLLRGISYRAGPLPNITIENNLVWAANANIPGGVMNLAFGGLDTLVEDFPNGDFAPTVPVKALGFTRRLASDLNRDAMPDPVAPGALAVAADELALFKPAFLSNGIAGTPDNGEALVAQWTAAGTQPITATYQWQKNGVNIAGQTGKVITLDAAGMGLVNGDTISCEITLSNIAGSTTIEPAVSYGPPLIDQLSASSATWAVYDWTNTAAMTAGDGGAVVPGAGDTIAVVPNAKNPGTRNRVQAASVSQPVYNAGALYDGSADFMQTTFAANTGPSNATLVYVVKTTDNEFMLAGCNSTSFFAGAAVSGSGSAPHSGTGFTSATYWANETQITTVTRDGLHSAWATGAAVTAEVRGVNYQNASITDIRDRYGNSGFNMNGRLMLIAVLDGSDPDFANALALARQEAARVIVALGL